MTHKKPKLVEFRTDAGRHATVRQDDIRAVSSEIRPDGLCCEVRLRGGLRMAVDYPYEVVAWHWGEGWVEWHSDILVGVDDCQVCGWEAGSQLNPQAAVCSRCGFLRNGEDC